MTFVIQVKGCLSPDLSRSPRPALARDLLTIAEHQTASISIEDADGLFSGQRTRTGKKSPGGADSSIISERIPNHCPDIHALDTLAFVVALLAGRYASHVSQTQPQTVIRGTSIS
jgi:hypothetical protein